MRSLFTVATAALTFVSVVLASPSPLLPVVQYEGKTNAGSYIVKLRDHVSKSSYLDALSKTLGSGSSVTYGDWDPSFFNGFAAKLDSKGVLTVRGDPNVEYISEDGLMQTSTVETNAPWGISRIAQVDSLKGQDPNGNFHYEYDPAGGNGVDAYIIDTGINILHVEFDNGRATWGATFGPYAPIDGNGHGTHCAGTVGGASVGVAKGVKLIAVKVLSDAGAGFTSDIVAGLDYVVKSAATSGRPSLASMSLGGSVSRPLDDAVLSAFNHGIHVVVAAGNSNVDAGNTSPAHVPEILTIGATDINDARASYSNFGSVVDLFAPGTNIRSAWTGLPNTYKTISGTSMATPHVTGTIAYLLSLQGNISPPDMEAKLKAFALNNALTDIPSGTVNALAQRGI